VTHRLEVVEGVQLGRVYDLVEDEVIVGRDEKCQIVLDDDSISRRHARLALDDDDVYVIEDLNSKNGTYVNDEMTDGKVPLKPDDRIEIGTTVFRYRSTHPVACESEEMLHTRVLCSIDAADTEHAMFKVNAESRLQAILQITKSLSRTLDLGGVLSKMLDGLFEIFPQADRGLVLLDEGGRLIPKAVKGRRSGQESVQYSRTLVEKVMGERRAILSQDATRDERIPAARSISRLQIRSVMCVPLLSQDKKVLGAVQLDIQDEKRKFSEDDMQILTSVASQASLSVEQAQLHREVIKHTKIQRELDFAREVQHRLLPRVMPQLEGYEFWAYYEAARQVGGDFYDFLRLPNGSEAVLLGDVAGKGVAAALMMSKVATLSKVALLSYPDNLSNAMNTLNEEVCDADFEMSFVTLVVCVIDPKTHEVTVANAGHLSPMFCRTDSTVDQAVGDDVRGHPLGIERRLTYRTGRTRIHPGELVVLLSDGISEAMNSSEETYSIERIREQLSRTAAQAPDKAGQMLLDDVRRHVGDSTQEDDISLVIFGRAPG